MNLSFSPSSMGMFLKCKEFYRLSKIENIEPATQNISLAFGRCAHLIAEGYWKGKGRMEAHTMALTEFNLLPPMTLPSKERIKWLNLGDSLAECVDAYYDFHGDEREKSKAVMMEQEFSHSISNALVTVTQSVSNTTEANPGTLALGRRLEDGGERRASRVDGSPHTISVSGRIDQLILHPSGKLELRELKTASEIVSEETYSRFGFSESMRDRWIKEYRESLLRNWGIQVYDWYLCQNARTSELDAPSLITVEVLLKPYRDKRPEMCKIDITEEVISYRERTAQQIEWITREMTAYLTEHKEKSPWPMATQDVCFGKYGACQYLPICNHGMTEKIAKLYRIKEQVAQ